MVLQVQEVSKSYCDLTGTDLTHFLYRWSQFQWHTNLVIWLQRPGQWWKFKWNALRRLSNGRSLHWFGILSVLWQLRFFIFIWNGKVQGYFDYFLAILEGLYVRLRCFCGFNDCNTPSFTMSMIKHYTLGKWFWFVIRFPILQPSIWAVDYRKHDHEDFKCFGSLGHELSCMSYDLQSAKIGQRLCIKKTKYSLEGTTKHNSLFWFHIEETQYLSRCFLLQSEWRFIISS